MTSVLALSVGIGSVSCYWGASDGGACLNDPCCRDPRGRLCQEARACQKNPEACQGSDGGAPIGNVVHPLDAGMPADAGAPDAGLPSEQDAGDAAVVEPADADTGPIDFDAGPPDAGLPDANDAAPADAGASGDDVDAGSSSPVEDAGSGDVDAGAPGSGDDAGAPDTGDDAGGVDLSDAGDADAGV